MTLRKLFVLVPLFAGMAAPAADVPQQKAPVLILAYSRFEDYSQMFPASDRVRRLLQHLEELRKAYPQQPFKPVFQFSGAMSNALHSLGEATQINQALRDGAAKGLFEFGYAGELEPTPRNRPFPDPLAKTPQERWLARNEAAQRFLTEYKDAVTGDPVPNLAGGLATEQKIFGNPTLVSGWSLKLGSDTPYIHQMKQLNVDGVLWGLPDPDPARGIHGYRGSVEGFASAMSPDPGTSPELYWEDNYLRSSDTSTADLRVFSTTEDLAKLKDAFNKLDRSKIRIVHLEYGSYLRYLRVNSEGKPSFHPLFWVWDHPQEPNMPNGIPAMVEVRDIEAKYQAEKATLKWLMENFLPANPGSRFVSATELKRMAETPLGAEIPQAALAAAADDLLAGYERSANFLPPFARSGDTFFSLADMFSLLVQSLSKEIQDGTPPARIRLTELYGPILMEQGSGPVNGEVSIAGIRHAAAELAPKLADTEWRALPSNMVPEGVTVDGVKLNSAQFLGLMAQAFRSKSPAERLRVGPRYMFSAAGLLYPRHVLSEDQGNVWTFRPARLHLTGAVASARF
jgi:hypothetical protein